jgi:hypothetical protein
MTVLRVTMHWVYDETLHSPFDFVADPSYALLLGAPLTGLTCEADWK